MKAQFFDNNSVRIWVCGLFLVKAEAVSSMVLTVTGSIQQNRNLAPASSKPMFSLMLSCNDDDDNDTPDTSKLVL